MGLSYNNVTTRYPPNPQHPTPFPGESSLQFLESFGSKQHGDVEIHSFEPFLQTFTYLTQKVVEKCSDMKAVRQGS